MKKLTAVLIVLLALAIMICSMPMAGAVSSSASYTYENSFLVTFEAKNFYTAYTADQLAGLMDVETCYILEREDLRYQLIVMNGDVPVEQDIERVKAIDGVVYAGRNKYAWDYAEHESSITLSQNYMEIPVGGTAALDIAETNLLYWMRDYRAQCVRIQVYHEICSYEKFNTMMWDLKTQNNFEDLKWYALYEDDSQMEYGETFLTVNLSEGLENRDVESPISQYVVDFDSRNELEVLQLVEKLAENPNVFSARIVYEIGMRGMPPVENWNVEDETVVTLTIQNNSSGFIGAPHTAILQGNQVGRTVVQVEYGHGNELCYATCIVNVVEGKTTFGEATYKNSFLLSFKSSVTSFEQLKTYLPSLGEYRLVEKKSLSGSRAEYLLEVVIGNTVSFEQLQDAMSRAATIPEEEVVVERNVLAADYREQASVLTLSSMYKEIPVGTTDTIRVADCKLETAAYSGVGVVVEVDHQKISYKQFKAYLEEQYQNDWYLTAYTMYVFDEQYAVEENSRLLYQHFSEYSFNTDDKVARENTQSPVNRYLLNFRFLAERDVVASLEQLSFIKTVRPVYDYALTGMPPHEEWSVENEDILSLTAESQDPYGLDAVVTITAKQVGQTVITVKRGGISVSLSQTCVVRVVEADSQSPVEDDDVTPTNIPYGDVNGDDEVDAKDALEVLKASVKKVELTPLQMLAAEVDGNDGINAKDALEILKYSVNKINKFPVEQVESENTMPSILYQFEYDGNGAPQQKDTQVILRSAGQVEEFLNVLDKAGLSNQQVTELLESRANGEYFQNYTLLVEYNHGVNGGDSGHQTIASIVKEGTTAKIEAVPNFTSDGAPDARYSAWVKIADLPNDKIEGCDTFVISYVAPSK